jgi:hypothetical protein
VLALLDDLSFRAGGSDELSRLVNIDPLINLKRSKREFIKRRYDDKSHDKYFNDMYIESGSTLEAQYKAYKILSTIFAELWLAEIDSRKFDQVEISKLLLMLAETGYVYEKEKLMGMMNIQPEDNLKSRRRKSKIDNKLVTEEPELEIDPSVLPGAAVVEENSAILQALVGLDVPDYISSISPQDLSGLGKEELLVAGAVGDERALGEVYDRY